MVFVTSVNVDFASGIFITFFAVVVNKGFATAAAVAVLVLVVAAAVVAAAGRPTHTNSLHKSFSISDLPSSRFLKTLHLLAPNVGRIICLLDA